jgi:hypothetical protein
MGLRLNLKSWDADSKMVPRYLRSASRLRVVYRYGMVVHQVRFLWLILKYPSTFQQLPVLYHIQDSMTDDTQELDMSFLENETLLVKLHKMDTM